MTDKLGPLTDGSTVVIIGGGPGGTGCALALKNLAEKLGRKIRIILYEGKIFENSTHYNQCAGVLSPPIVEILESWLRIPFPWDLVQRKIAGYVLHSAKNEITLKGTDDFTYALRRVTFDDYLLKRVEERGVEVIQSRVTDVEFSDDGVIVYSESDNNRGEIVVGAFGLDDGTAKIFERTTSYRQPPFLSSIVTKIHPEEAFMSRFGNLIHAFLLPIKKVEFGAVTPKRNHLTVNIAGMKISSDMMDEFLRFPSVRAILPRTFDPWNNELMYFKGKFPFRVSRGFYGDRYVVVGDAAGLLRPFKGKGVNMSIVTSLRAAETIMTGGISEEAFEKHYRGACREIMEDIPYGKVLRRLALASSNSKFLDTLIDVAKEEPLLRNALFNCVSAHRSFKDIFRETWSTKLIMKILRHTADFVRRV